MKNSDVLKCHLLIHHDINNTKSHKNFPVQSIIFKQNFGKKRVFFVVVSLGNVAVNYN